MIYSEITLTLLKPAHSSSGRHTSISCMPLLVLTQQVVLTRLRWNILCPSTDTRLWAEGNAHWVNASSVVLWHLFFTNEKENEALFTFELGVFNKNLCMLKGRGLLPDFYLQVFLINREMSLTNIMWKQATAQRTWFPFPLVIFSEIKVQLPIFTLFFHALLIHGLEIRMFLL